MRYTALIIGFFACSSPGSPGAGGDGGGGTTDGHQGGSNVDAFVPQDSPPGPFGCLGQPVPTTAPDPLALGGSAVTINGTSEVPATGVTVKVLAADGTTVLGTATSDANGAYTMSLTTGGHALDAHLYATKNGDLDSAVYPATAIYTNTNGGAVVIITSANLNLLGELSGPITVDTSKGQIGVIVTDCEGNLLPGAKVTTEPQGKTVYLGTNGLPDTGADSTAASGIALVFNVAPGAVTIGATVNGMTLRNNPITAAAGIVTTAAIRP